MEPIREDPNKQEPDDLHKHDEQKRLSDGLARGGRQWRVLFAEPAALADDVYRASQEEEFNKSKRGTNEPIESLSLAQAPPEPPRSKHRDDQCAAACTDDSFRL